MRRLVVLLLAGAALILLVAQLALPPIAADRISSRVGRYGVLESVSVSAWPALQLLWGSADSATVRARRLRLSPSQAAKLVWEARGVDSLELVSSAVTLGRVRLSDARLHKRGSSLAAEALIGEADVKAALPRGLSVRLLASEAGQVKVAASGGLFGGGPTVTAVAAPSEGRLVVHPIGPPLQNVRLALFADRHVHVDGVGASARPRSPRSYRLTMSAHLR